MLEIVLEFVAEQEDQKQWGEADEPAGMHKYSVPRAVQVQSESRGLPVTQKEGPGSHWRKQPPPLISYKTAPFGGQFVFLHRCKSR